MNRVGRLAGSLWERHAGGWLPIVRAGRDVFVGDRSTTYWLHITWGRCGWRQEWSRPGLPRSVRRAVAADNARVAEVVRRQLAGEPAVQVGDHIQAHAIGFLKHVAECRDVDYLVWKRAEGDERYPVGPVTGHVDRSREYGWVMWRAGEWGAGWRTDEEMLEHAPLSVLMVVRHVKR